MLHCIPQHLLLSYYYFGVFLIPIIIKENVVADICDRADETWGPIVDARIKTSSNSAKNLNINGDGFCLCCGAPVEPVLFGGKNITPRWCGKECQIIWDRE